MKGTSAILASRYPIQDGNVAVEVRKLQEYVGVQQIDHQRGFIFVVQVGKLFALPLGS